MIPTVGSVDEDFLTEVLQDAGHDVVVVSFDQAHVGTGQIGQCLRYRLQLRGADGTCPTSLVAKFASEDPTSRATGVMLRNYLREVRFYQELQDQVSIRTPRCYYADIEGEGPNFALVLEDLAPAVQGDQLTGCSPGVATAAVMELIGLHAPSWNDPSLSQVDWLVRSDDAEGPTAAEIYGQLITPFLERFGDRLEPKVQEIFDRVARSAGPPFVYPSAPTALIHIDYRLDNLLIDTGSAPPTVIAVDWQSITVGNPLIDVAYFLGASMLPADRRQHERRIVEGYHQGLLASGVEDYSWEACWQDYRRGVFSGFAVTVIGSMLVVETDRGNDMFTAMAQRHAQHAIDLGGAEFL